MVFAVVWYFLGHCEMLVGISISVFKLKLIYTKNKLNTNVKLSHQNLISIPNEANFSEKKVSHNIENKVTDDIAAQNLKSLIIFS